MAEKQSFVIKYIYSKPWVDPYWIGIIFVGFLWIFIMLTISVIFSKEDRGCTLQICFMTNFFSSKNFQAKQFLCVCFFLRPHLQHRKVPSIGVQSEAAAAGLLHSHSKPDVSHACDLHHSSLQCQICNTLSKARDWTHILMDTSRVHYSWATKGTQSIFFWKWRIGKCWARCDILKVKLNK